MMQAMTREEKLAEAARLLGEAGGSAGGKASAAKMTRRQRKARAAKAAEARWTRYREQNPEPKPRTYLGLTAKRLLARLRRFRFGDDGNLVVSYDDSKRPSGRREFDAAMQLVLAGKAREVARHKTPNGEQVVIART